jgi:hypothetical protein
MDVPICPRDQGDDHAPSHVTIPRRLAKTFRPVFAGMQSIYQAANPKEKRKKRGTASHQHGAPHTMAIGKGSAVAVGTKRTWLGRPDDVRCGA